MVSDIEWMGHSLIRDVKIHREEIGEFQGKTNLFLKTHMNNC